VGGGVTGGPEAGRRNREPGTGRQALKLYKKHKLTQDEIAFIEKTIRPMEADGE